MFISAQQLTAEDCITERERNFFLATVEGVGHGFCLRGVCVCVFACVCFVQPPGGRESNADGK